MTLRTIRKHAEQAVAELEARRQKLVDQRRRVPHRLAERLAAARLHALRIGRRAR